MKSKPHGKDTSVVEITHIDSRGLWIYVDGFEHYMPFDVFPWFQDATVKQISAIERYREDHFRWSELDIDLTLDMIEHPEKYPLKYSE